MMYSDLMHSLGPAAPHLPLEGDLPADHRHLGHLKTQCRYLHWISRHISTLQCGYLHYISMYIYCMHQGDAAAPPGALFPVCLQHGGVGVGVVAEEAHPGQPQEHLGSVSPLHHSTQYTLHCTLYTVTLHCTLYHALQDVMLPPGARYHEAAPVLPAAAEPDLGHENVQSMSQTIL